MIPLDWGEVELRVERSMHLLTIAARRRWFSACLLTFFALSGCSGAYDEAVVRKTVEDRLPALRAGMNYVELRQAFADSGLRVHVIDPARRYPSAGKPHANACCSCTSASLIVTYCATVDLWLDDSANLQRWAVRTHASASIDP